LWREASEKAQGQERMEKNGAKIKKKGHLSYRSQLSF